MNAKFGASGVTAFFLDLKPLTFPHEVTPAIYLRPVSRRNIHRVLAFSAGGLLGSGLALSSIYAWILKGGHNANNGYTHFQWIEYPNYVPPEINLFVEDQVPFAQASSSPAACPKDSEHLERLFEELRYQHLFKTLGVPSVVNHNIHVVQPLRVQGTDTSSGFVHKVLSTAKYGLYSDSMSREGLYDISYPTGVWMAFVALLTFFALLAKHIRWSRLSVFTNYAGKGDNNVVCDGTCALPTFNKEPPPRLVIGLLCNPDSEQFIAGDDLDCYTPFVVLQFLDDYTPRRSDVKLLEDASTTHPDGFAALFDAPRDALALFLRLRNLTSESLPQARDLVRLVLLCIAIVLCFGLRVMVFLVKGRIGRRGIQQLLKEMRVTVGKFPVSPEAAIYTENEDDSELPEVVETPVKKGLIELVLGDPEPVVFTAEQHQAYEEIVIRYLWLSMLENFQRLSDSAVVVNKTVETELAPVIDDKAGEDNGKGIVVNKRHGGQKAKDNVGEAETKEQVSAGPVAGPSIVTNERVHDSDPPPSKKQLRGTRGRGRRLHHS